MTQLSPKKPDAFKNLNVILKTMINQMHITKSMKFNTISSNTWHPRTFFIRLLIGCPETQLRDIRFYLVIKHTYLSKH